jgi:DNA polymerase-3 subunit gamma/tau
MPAYYLKYRPQTVAELDLKNIRQQLKKLLSSEQIPHALLFAGPKGTGKTSSARIVAKAVNCPENGDDFEPCNECSLCKSITSGRSLDLIEIDGASNRGIDDIRELREQIKLSPNEADYKVYVIDEVHMLTTQAFNALLKTLEEPPEHAIFILCTTEPHKLPDTIISRCLRFDFRRANSEEVKRSLERVVAGEELEVSEQVLTLIAENAGGSFRDATKVLEQLSLGQKKITIDEVKKFLDKGSNIKIDRITEQFLKGETEKVLQAIEKSADSGVDFEWLVKEILSLIHKKMLAACEKNDQEKTALMIDAIKVLDQAGRELRGAIIPQIPLEIVVIEWSGRFKNAKKNPQNKKTTRKKKSLKSKKSLQKDNKRVKKGRVEKKNIKENKKEQQAGCEEIQIKVAELKEKWPIVQQKVKPANHSISALLKASKPVELKQDKVFVEVFYKFHKEKLEEDKCMLLVEKAMQEVYDQALKLRYVLSNNKRKRVATVGDRLKNNSAESEEDDNFIKVAEKVFS